MSYLIGGVGRKGLLPTPDEFAAHYEGGRNQEGWEGGRDSGRTTVKQTKKKKLWGGRVQADSVNLKLNMKLNFPHCRKDNGV